MSWRAAIVPAIVLSAVFAVTVSHIRNGLSRADWAMESHVDAVLAEGVGLAPAIGAMPWQDIPVDNSLRSAWRRPLISGGKLDGLFLWRAANRPEADPREIAAAVLYFARQYDLKPSLILSMIETESGFNADSVSHRGAVGLMQVLPHGGGREALGFLSGKPAIPAPDTLFRPATNIALGTTYLHILGTKYFGKITDPLSRLYVTIAAYNAGPGGVALALTKTRDTDKAVAEINKLSSKSLFALLIKRMRSKETASYLIRVTKGISRFTHWDGAI